VDRYGKNINFIIVTQPAPGVEIVTPMPAYPTTDSKATATPVTTAETNPTTPPTTPEGMVYIPAGEFPMGCDPNHSGGEKCWDDQLPLHTVYLDAYYIDKYEVTNDQMAAFLNSRGSNDCDGYECVVLESYNSSSRILYSGGQYLVESGYGDHPVHGIIWYGANSYCTENDKRLPSEAEWEKAARGTTLRAYPWGDNAPTCALTNFADPFDYRCLGDTVPVGSYPSGASPYGVFEMAGNVTEWVNNWYSEDYYESCATGCINPTGLTSGIYRLMRGGSWGYFVGGLPIANRYPGKPDGPLVHNGFGFRCAVSVPGD